MSAGGREGNGKLERALGGVAAVALNGGEQGAGVVGLGLGDLETEAAAGPHEGRGALGGEFVGDEGGDAGVFERGFNNLGLRQGIEGSEGFHDRETRRRSG